MLKGPAAVGSTRQPPNLVLYFNVIAAQRQPRALPAHGAGVAGQPAEFRRLRDLSLRLVALVGVPVTVGSLLLAPRTIDFLYGAELRGRPS